MARQNRKSRDVNPAYRQLARARLHWAPCLLLAATVGGGWASAGCRLATAAEPIRDIVYATVDGHDLLADVYLPTAPAPPSARGDASRGTTLRGRLARGNEAAKIAPADRTSPSDAKKGPPKSDSRRAAAEGEKSYPAVLCIHGGAWATGHRSQMALIARRLASEGFVAVTIEYRLAPTYRYPAQYDDCVAALAWLRANAARYHADPKRVALWGYSAGGHLALLVGLREHGVQAIVAGGAPSDFHLLPADNPMLGFWLGGTRREMPDVYDEASPATHVDAHDPPTFLYHGESDPLVPVPMARAMHDRLTRVGVVTTLKTLPGAGHIQAFVNAEAMDSGVEFLKQHLGDDAATAK